MQLRRYSQAVAGMDQYLEPNSESPDDDARATLVNLRNVLVQLK